MSPIGSRSPIRRSVFWVSAAVLPLTVLTLVWWFASLGEAHQGNRTSLDVALPPRPPEAGSTIRTVIDSPSDGSIVEGAPANPAFTAPILDPLKPREPDLELVDASPFGPLPRIADDGRWPLQTYARPYDRSDDRPKVAVMMTGLGLQADATNAAFHLPGAISLMFSPYTEDLPALFERARLAGHEVLVELPMEPDDYPASDPGPHTLRASGTVDANLERLTWVLARAQGFFAVAGQGGAFAGSAEASPVMKALAARGVGMIEIDGDGLSNAGKEAGLSYLSTPDWIDATPSADAIDQALADLETRARADGSALGVAEAYPVTLKQLVDWTSTLEQRGIVLVPVSAILMEKSGTSPDDRSSSVAQSDN